MLSTLGEYPVITSEYCYSYMAQIDVIPSLPTSLRNSERTIYNCNNSPSSDIDITVIIPPEVKNIDLLYSSRIAIMDLTYAASLTTLTPIHNDALKTLIIGQYVTNIKDEGEYYYEGGLLRYTDIENILVNNNKKYDSRNNCNAIIETATNTLVAGCKNTIIPDTVTSVGNYAFYNCDGLSNITISNSVKNIGKSAFYGCKKLTSVSILEETTNIGDYAFRYCSNLTNVTIPDNVKSIGIDAFDGCSSLTSVTIPNNITSIGYSAFEDGCNISYKGQTYTNESEFERALKANGVTILFRDD